MWTESWTRQSYKVRIDQPCSCSKGKLLSMGEEEEREEEGGRGGVGEEGMEGEGEEG